MRGTTRGLMSEERFIHKVYLGDEYEVKDNDFALASLVADTFAVYYWCEAFAERRKSHDNHVRMCRKLCVMGQRGLADYAARATEIVLRQLKKRAEEAGEDVGYQFGAVTALRESLRERRVGEQSRPEYMDQLNVSTYRAKRELAHKYKVGVVDARATFEMGSYERGMLQKWSLDKFRDPIYVLNSYAEKTKDYRHNAS